MGIYQTGHDVPAREPLSSWDRLSDQAPGRIHPQISRPVTIWQLHRAHSPRHSGIISRVSFCVRCQIMVREATVRWRRCYDRIGACDGIELLGVFATARERFSDAARQPLQRWFVRHEEALTEAAAI